MKKLSLFPILLFLLAVCLTQEANGQAFGKKPELVMQYHNSGQGGLMPAEQGDTIGTIKWNALTEAPNIIRNGAQIRGVVSGPVLYNVLPTDLLFRTSNSEMGPQDRMILTADGLVGIGTMTPGFNLDVVGNTHTSGDFYGRIHFDDNQLTDDAPDTYIDEAYFELKQRSVLNLPAGLGTHGGLFSLAPGATSFDHQMFFAEDGIFTRRTDGQAADWSAATWYKILTGEDINGTPNRIAKFTGPNSLGDSQLFDDGVDVGIGTTSPDVNFLLTVNGDTRVNGLLRATGDLQADDNVSAMKNISAGDNVTAVKNISAGINITAGQNITATNNITANQNLIAVNDATVGSDLVVNNDATVLNQMSVGTADKASGYALSVDGKIITDELRVMLSGSWPDYVFADDYQLPKLPELEQFIRTNKHLPGLPSAAEVEAAGGVDVGAMQRQLLEKIEELTLLAIEQQKQIDALKAELNQSKN